jgi:hypothetical protein
MAAETPFGASFGDPRQYMGKSPLAQIGQAAKLGLVLTGLHKSGAIKALDNMGVKLDDKGTFSYKPPAGAVPPITSGSGGVNADGVFGTNPMPVSPMTFNQPAMPSASVPPMGVQVTPLGQDAPSNVQINTFAPPAPDAGMQLLNNTYRPQSSVDVKNETDFNPLAPDTSNQMAVSPDDYKNAPGYGSTEKALKAFLPFLLA